MTINVEAFRQIADRIDTKTRPPGTARYNQKAYAIKRDKYHDAIVLKEIVMHECHTECCVAGHAFVLAEGVEKYLANVSISSSVSFHGSAKNFLGLSVSQASALFDSTISPGLIKFYFGVDMGWNGYRSAKRVATLLRAIADRYERGEK